MRTYISVDWLSDCQDAAALYGYAGGARDPESSQVIQYNFESENIGAYTPLQDSGVRLAADGCSA